MLKKKYPIAVLISGNGSNLQAILDAIQAGRLAAEIAVVISDKPDAYGLHRAQTAGVKTEILAGNAFRHRADYDAALLERLRRYHPELIVLAGFMRILSPLAVQAYYGRIINIHPALLPKYPGLNTHQRVLQTGDKEHGTSIHFVTEALDAGPLIAQAKLFISPEETPESLKNRVQQLEHQLYPRVISWFAEKRVTLQQTTVYLDQQPLPSGGCLVDVTSAKV